MSFAFMVVSKYKIIAETIKNVINTKVLLIKALA